MSRHAARKNFALNDFVRRFAADHSFTRKFLAAGGTSQIAVGSVIEDAFDETFDEATSTSLAVFVQQCSAT